MGILGVPGVLDILGGLEILRVLRVLDVLGVSDILSLLGVPGVLTGGTCSTGYWDRVALLRHVYLLCISDCRKKI